MGTRQAVPPLLTQIKLILLRYRFILLSLFVALIGVALSYIAVAVLSPGVTQVMLRDVGLALFTAGTIGLAVDFYTRRQFLELVNESVTQGLESSPLNLKLDEIQKLGQLGKDVQLLGIKEIHLQRHNINFIEHIDQADPGTEIRLLGICMLSFTHAPMQVAIESRLREGCSFKLLILDSSSEFVKQRAIEEKRDYQDISQDIAAANQLHTNFINHRLAPELRERIQLRHYDSAPSYFILSTSRVMIVGFYLRDLRGEFFPHLELETKGGGIFLPFLNHFDSLWEASQPKKL